MSKIGFGGELGRTYRSVGMRESGKSQALQSLESVNARIVFAIAGNNLSMVQTLLPQLCTPEAKELIERGQLFLGVVRDRDTYLHLAAKGNKPVIFKALLDFGFGKDLDIPNKANLKAGQYASPAINAMIQQYKSEQAGKLGGGQGVLVAAKLAESPAPVAK